MKSIVDKRIERVGLRVHRLVKRWAVDNALIHSESLMGGCGIAAYTLWEAFKVIGIKSKLVVVEGGDGYGCHCWVEVNGWIVDVTATQFSRWNYPITITKACFKRKDSEVVYFNEKAVKILGGWDEQSPLVYKREIGRFLNRLRREK